MGLPNEMVTHKKGAKNKNRPVKKSKPASANGHVRNHTIEENGNHLDIPEPQNFKVKCIFSLIETTVGGPLFCVPLFCNVPLILYDFPFLKLQNNGNILSMQESVTENCIK